MPPQVPPISLADVLDRSKAINDRVQAGGGRTYTGSGLRARPRKEVALYTASARGRRLVPRQATFALLMVSALMMTSRSRGWVAACRFRQAM